MECARKAHDQLWTGLNTLDKGARVAQNGALIGIALGLFSSNASLKRAALAAGAVRSLIGGLKGPRDCLWLLFKDEEGHRIFFKHKNKSGVFDYHKGVLSKQLPLLLAHAIAFSALFKPKSVLLSTIGNHCCLVGLSAQFLDQVNRHYCTRYLHEKCVVIPDTEKPSRAPRNLIGTGLDLAYTVSEVTLKGFSPPWLAQTFGVLSGGYWLLKVWGSP